MKLGSERSCTTPSLSARVFLARPLEESACQIFRFRPLIHWSVHTVAIGPLPTARQVVGSRQQTLVPGCCSWSASCHACVLRGSVSTSTTAHRALCMVPPDTSLATASWNNHHSQSKPPS
jgi:hypothetical protein